MQVEATTDRLLSDTNLSPLQKKALISSISGQEFPGKMNKVKMSKSQAQFILKPTLGSVEQLDEVLTDRRKKSHFEEEEKRGFD